jgi:hypothetical protein
VRQSPILFSRVGAAASMSPNPSRTGSSTFRDGHRLLHPGLTAASSGARRPVGASTSRAGPPSGNPLPCSLSLLDTSGLLHLGRSHSDACGLHRLVDHGEQLGRSSGRTVRPSRRTSYTILESRREHVAQPGDLLGYRAASTAATYYKVLRILYRWLEEEDELARDPTAKMKRRSCPSSPSRWSPEDGLRPAVGHLRRQALRGPPRHRTDPAAGRRRPPSGRADGPRFATSECRPPPD